MLRYPATFTPAEEGGYVVEFPDIPEAITQGDSLDEAREMAADALATALEFYFDDNRAVPMPSEAGADHQVIELPASLSAKVLLLNEMVAQHVTQSELARRLHVTPQHVQRIVDLGHTTKIDTIATALSALGKRLELRVT
jgi:antitoxin HicB